MMKLNKVFQHKTNENSSNVALEAYGNNMKCDKKKYIMFRFHQRRVRCYFTRKFSQAGHY